MCRVQEQKRSVSLYAKILHASIVLMLAPLLFGCATNWCDGDDSPAVRAREHKLKFTLLGLEESKYKEVQQKIRTNEDYLYHDAVVEYGSYETRYSFYLLGFEKPRDKNDIGPYCKLNEVDCQTPRFDPKNFLDGLGDIQTKSKTRKKISIRIYSRTSGRLSSLTC